MTVVTTRLARLSPSAVALAQRLMTVAMRGLPTTYRTDSDEFAFTRAATSAHGSVTELRGASLRYAAIVALGAHWLPEQDQRQVLTGHSAREFVGLLVERLGRSTNLGDVALVCWSAAQSAPESLLTALRRLDEVDRSTEPRFVVEAAWVVSALAAARGLTDVEEHLDRARSRLLGSVVPGSPLFPHQSGPGLVRSYRSHVACFADQVYPIQALARLHASGDDPEALKYATTCADRICRLQGAGGQWWWHYDARTGDLIEGYPVYTVHQHAMGPMALHDLADAGGADHRDAIEKGLMWIESPAELPVGAESMIRDDAALTWRKVYRGDPRKIIRGAQTVVSRIHPGLRVPAVDKIYRARAIDRECRPYEFGWLLFAWLARLGDTTPIPAASGRHPSPDDAS